MLEPVKTAGNYEAEKARMEKEIKEGNGITSFGTSHQAVDIMKSPLVTGEKPEPEKAKK